MNMRLVQVIPIMVWVLVGSGGLAVAQLPVAEWDQIRFHSSFWVNLHFTLYAEAVRTLKPGPELPRLEAPSREPMLGDLNSGERVAWDEAIAYYGVSIARRDLAYGENMMNIQRALADSVDTLAESSAIAADHRRHLLAAAPIYRRHWWPQHDRAIRAWIEDVSTRLREVGPHARQRQVALLESGWLKVPVRAEITFFGRAYTMMRREVTLTTMAAGAPNYAGWAGSEMMFHEVSHSLTGPDLSGPFEERIRREAAALGKKVPGGLWHLCLFYITGEVWRSELAARGIQYDPYLYATGLFDRDWKSLRVPVETHLKPYMEGRISAQTAFRGLIESIPE
jgi:hypothetical protein